MIRKIVTVKQMAGAGDRQSVGTALLRPNKMEMFASEVMFSSDFDSAVIFASAVMFSSEVKTIVQCFFLVM